MCAKPVRTANARSELQVGLRVERLQRVERDPFIETREVYGVFNIPSAAKAAVQMGRIRRD